MIKNDPSKQKPPENKDLILYNLRGEMIKGFYYHGEFYHNKWLLPIANNIPIIWWCLDKK